MGSDDGCLKTNGFHLNGLLPNKAASVTKVLDLERWTRAEERTAQLIAHIQPDRPSWEHRNAIASYVQRLIAQCIPCVVFSYGSVPLKTYLPDGDIDLTVFSQDQNLNDNWAIEVRDMLEKEEKNEDAEYCIREVQLIHAEVKLVKCLVDNIVVDLSFSQLSGLCTLCFLEEVDRYIGQNHLFKRSIILIKAWCYYESRLLGAYHGLISTYALETLILYIFHVFNNSFAGPLEVLYRFLDFFSKFDWDNFCISLRGPVPIGSLPDMTADPPRQDEDALFFDACSNYYSVPPSTHEIKERFISKHFNIIDFLRTNNNLGRSVSKGNFFRVRSAFAFGAQRLAGLLDCPKECVVAELNRFFVNTWDRHGKVHRPDTCTASDLGQESEQIVQKRNSNETNLIAFEKGDMRLNASQMSLNDGEKSGRSEVLQNGVRFGQQFARTCSSPELMNVSSKLLREGISTERGRQQDNSISESDHSGKTGNSRVADSRHVKFNTVDPPTRENSPSESYDGDVDSASTSSRIPGDYVVGEEISCGVKPVQKSANVMHPPPWIQSFGRQCAGFSSPKSQWNLNLYYPHGLSSVPITGRFDDDVQPESSTKQVDDRGFWDDDVCSSLEQNTENGFIGSEHMEKRQNSRDVVPLMSNSSLDGRLRGVATMDPKTVVSDDNLCQSQANGFEHCHEVNGCKDGIPLSGPETSLPPIAIPHTGALQVPIADMNYPTPNWVFPMPLYPCWPSASNEYPVFPVPFLPAGSANPYGSMLPYLPYTSQFKGKENNLSVYHCGPTLDTAKNSSKSKMANGMGSAEHSEEFASDILSGDISSLLRNMLYGKSCQNLQFQCPFVYHPYTVPGQYLQGEFPSGDPGRPSIPPANDTVLPETPLIPVSHHHPNQSPNGAYQYYPKGNPRHGTGTGTYFPNPKNSRDFQALNSRYHRGNNRYHRKEQHREREVNSDFNSRQRFGGRPRKWEKPNSRFDRSTTRNHQSHWQWEVYGNYSHPTYHPMVYDRYMVYPYEPNSGYVSVEHPSADCANSSPDQPSSPRYKGSVIV